MAATGTRGLNEAMKALSISVAPSRLLAGGLVVSSSSCRRSKTTSMRESMQTRNFTRSMATETSLPGVTTSLDQEPRPNLTWLPTSTVPVTIHAFPTMEPRTLEEWSVRHLAVPLRRDLLHRAVVFEGDATRQGTASSKTRWEVKASGRKLRPQKGSGRARLGDAGSPMLRGGGKTFGPKPRDFSTRLNRKVYDLAWRIALSHRYRRGELFVCEDGVELPLPRDFTDLLAVPGVLSDQLAASYRGKAAAQLLDAHRWGRAFGRTTFVTTDRRPELFAALEVAGRVGRALELEDVDVKDLLETGRIVIERTALREMIEAHQSDLVSKIFLHGVAPAGPPLGTTVVS